MKADVHFIALTVAALFGAGALQAGVEEPVELNSIPTAIMDIASSGLADLKLAVGAAEISDDSDVIDDNLAMAYEDLGEVQLVSANTETEDDGSVVFEIQGVADKGRKVEIDITPEGDILEIEIEFYEEDVPGAVLKAIEQEMPGFAPVFIEASHSPSMQVIGYEFVGEIGEDALDIEVSADGRNIIVADQ